MSLHSWRHQRAAQIQECIREMYVQGLVDDEWVQQVNRDRATICNLANAAKLDELFPYWTGKEELSLRPGDLVRETGSFNNAIILGRDDNRDICVAFLCMHATRSDTARWTVSSITNWRLECRRSVQDAELQSLVHVPLSSEMAPRETIINRLCRAEPCTSWDALYQTASIPACDLGDLRSWWFDHMISA